MQNNNPANLPDSSLHSTEEMLNDLVSQQDFQSFSNQHHAEFIDTTLSFYLHELLAQKNISKAEVIRRANLDRVYGYQIFNGTRTPTREKLFQLAFGFELTFQETQTILKIAGMAPLYAKIKREAAIIFCLNKKYTLDQAQEFLYEADLRLMNDE